VVKKALPTASEAEALAKFKKAYPSVVQMGAGFPAFGADALRFTLATFPPSNKRIALAPKRIEGNRHFVNKIWNATRFALEHLKACEATTSAPRPQPKGFYNRWILSRLATATQIAHAGFDAFRIDEAALEAYRFFWNDLCDWYLELTKLVFGRPGDAPAAEDPLAGETRETLAYVLEASLRLLHPMMPYVTEELWQKMPRRASGAISIALAPYPRLDDGAPDPAVDREMETVKSVITAARTIRSEHEVHPAAPVPLAVRASSDAARAVLSKHGAAMKALIKADGAVAFVDGTWARPAGTTVSVVSSDSGSIEVLIGLLGLVTEEKELLRIEREIKRIDKDLAALDKKLGGAGFLDRAPKEVIEESRALRANLAQARVHLEESRALARELGNGKG